MKTNNYDVISLGETMLRLAPPLHQRLEQCSSLDVTVGGAEMSVVCNLAGIGYSTAWISRLPDIPMGRFVANKAREQGVDTRFIVWSNDSNDRTGLYFVEMGVTPRPSQVFYDRKNSAISNMSASEIDWDSIFKNTRIFHTSGITPALSQKCHDLTIDVFELARKYNCMTSFDLNYRSKLWNIKDASTCFKKILPYVDILITNPFDCRKFFDMTGTDRDIFHSMSQKFDIQTIAFTFSENLGVNSGTWRSSIFHRDKIYESSVQDVEILDRFGAGDAFVSGLLGGMLDDDPEYAQKLGDAMAILSQTTFSDISWIRKSDLNDYFQNKGFRIRR